MSDDTLDPVTVEPAVAAVVTERPPAETDHTPEEVRLLLVYDRHHEAWTLPMGRLDPGESLADCVCREVLEETGVEVAVDGLVGVYSDPATQVYEHRSGNVVQMVTTVLRCSPTTDEPESLSPEPDDVEEVADAAFRPRTEVVGAEPLDQWVRDELDDGDAVLQ
jgi:ADP-ribose pyrophosphatase YjhB (NUDIX family)